jgi:hypothetical protein
MTPLTQDIGVKLGETWDFICTCHTPNNTPINLTDAQWRMASSTTLILSANVGNGITLLGNGALEIQITPAMQNTANALPGIYNHELFVSGNNIPDSFVIDGKIIASTSLKKSYG